MDDEARAREVLESLAWYKGPTGGSWSLTDLQRIAAALAAARREGAEGMRARAAAVCAEESSDERNKAARWRDHLLRHKSHSCERAASALAAAHDRIAALPLDGAGEG